MKGKLRLALSGFVITVLLLGASPALAAPTLPHVFYGTVTINGADAAAGTVVSAKVGGVDCGSYTIEVAGHYGNRDECDYLVVQGDISNGDTVTFYVRGILTDTDTFSAGGGPTEKNLALVMPLFSVANLSIQPLEVQPNEVVTITVSVANTGGTEGSYTVVLMIEGVKEAEQSVTVAAGSSEIVTFFVTREETGSYSVAVDGLSASFTVIPEITGEVVETVPTGQTDYVVDASATADTTITVDTTAEVTITVKKYRSNPHSKVDLPAEMLPRYIDIEVDNPGAVVWPMYVVQTYTPDEVAGLDESSLGMYYFEAGAWHRCSDTGVNTAADYVWAYMTSDELAGSPVAIGGTAAPPPGGGGGGGPTPPPLPPGTTDVSAFVNVYGIFTMSVIAESEDDICRLIIEAGTEGLAKDKEPLSQLTIVGVDEPSTPPEDAYAYIIGLAYDLGPNGVTFDPAITLTINYDPASLPEGVAEQGLYIAYWDGSEWNSLATTVNVEANTVSCQLSHFTVFAVIGAVAPPPPPAPAAFSVSDLSVQPAEAEPKEAVTITVSVANTGGTEGSYTVVLMITGVKEAEKSVTVAAGESQYVTFSVTREEAGSYSVVVDGLSASFTVVVPPPAPPAPLPEVKPPINWPIVGGIIAAVILVVFIATRRYLFG